MESNYKPWGMEENMFLLLMHLSILAGSLIPVAGIVLPIVMWATNKDESINIDNHGKVILNWMLSCLIYLVVSFILIVVYIGVLGIVALAILNLVFAVIGAVKAHDGVLWNYPLSIKFFKVEEPVVELIEKDS